MNNTNKNTGSGKWLHLAFGTILLISFFLPWVSWEGATVSGYSMPAGDFFKTSESKFGLANPFPQYNFGLLAFWLIPALTVIALALFFANKKSSVAAFIAGALSLSLITVFILFSKTLLSLGVGKSLTDMLKPGLFIHAIAAIGFILSALSGSLLKKIAWVVTGPVFAFASFSFIEKYLENDTHKDTGNVKADYTISSNELIKEFITNDTATNKKYLDKVLVVNGPASSVEIAADSTSTIKFADSTGSYAIFSLEKSEITTVKNIKSGDAVSLKGVCSGSIFSDILGTTSISFKRGILNKK
jgi:tRNA_anti-like